MWRGAQSALFFYASCAPCAEASYRRKRKREVKRGQAEQEARAAENPNLYRQALPTATNPYWQTEIAAGPTLAARGKKKSNNSKKGRRANDGGVASWTDLSSRVGSRDGAHDSRLDFQRYQRDDEEPWDYASTDRLASGTTLGDSVHSSSGITKPPPARIRGTDTSYSSYRSPPINDLHPPVATKINSRAEARWLMQPPPAADVMNGKERASRSRSTSGGSNTLSSRSAVPVSRQVSQKMMARKLQVAGLPSTLTMPHERLMRTTSGTPRGQRHDRSGTNELDFAQTTEAAHPSTNPAPRLDDLSEPSNNRSQDITTPRNDLSLSSDPPEQQKHPARGPATLRPQLSTIFSDSIISSSTAHPNLIRAPAVPKDENRSSTRSNNEQDTSLSILKDLAPSSALFRARIVSSTTNTSDDEDLTKKVSAQSAKSGQALPPLPRDTTSDETIVVAAAAAGGSREEEELFDVDVDETWGRPDFELGEWVAEHTKREVSQRWSMDI